METEMFKSDESDSWELKSWIIPSLPYAWNSGEVHGHKACTLGGVTYGREDNVYIRGTRSWQVKYGMVKTEWYRTEHSPMHARSMRRERTNWEHQST